MTSLHETTAGKEVEPGGHAALEPVQQRAVWIASYPKSGNTWVRVFIHNLVRELLGQGETAHDINALHEMTLRGLLIEHFEDTCGKPPSEASDEEIAEARAKVQAGMVRGADGPVYIKTHNAVATIAGFPTINFDVTLAAVYIVRNPLDVAVSYAHFSGQPTSHIVKFMTGAASDYNANGERVVYEFLGSWSFHAASWMSVPHRPILLLRYEDMLTAPERTFGRLATFLRFKPNACELRRAIEKSSFTQLARQEEISGFIERPKTTEKFFRSGKAGQWREALPQTEVEAIVRDHGPMMMRFGYLPEDCGRGRSLT